MAGTRPLALPFLFHLLKPQDKVFFVLIRFVFRWQGIDFDSQMSP